MVLSTSLDGFMYSVRWPCASRSMSNTLCPNSASAAPRFTAVVVLPTPPFCIATAIVRAKSDASLTQGGQDRPNRGCDRSRASTIGRGVRDPSDRDCAWLFPWGLRAHGLAPMIIDAVVLLALIVALLLGY